LIIIATLLFIRSRGNNRQNNVIGINQQMAKTYAVPQQSQNYQPTQAYVQQPVTAADPAREYYQNLLNQGYPHEHAVAYTQQYFPNFMG